MRALKMRSTAARPLEGDDDQLRVIMEADPLTTKWEAAKGLNVNCSMVAQHLKRIEKVKYLTKWVLHELISYPKYHHFEALSSYSMQQQWTISRYNCDMWWKSRFYTTTSSDQLSGWTNEKLQSTSQSHTYIKKKGSLSLFDGLPPVWFTTEFWIPAKPLHLRSMLSKSVRCTKNGNACSWHKSTERAQFFSTLPTDCTI